MRIADAFPALCMSIYRPLQRPPRNDVHQVGEHIVGPDTGQSRTASPAGEEDWASRRKARPAETLLPVATRWLAALPMDCYPLALAKTFPRIANALATFWTRPDALMSYLSELLVDRRGGRKGFPLDVLDELHQLEAYYSSLHPEFSSR
jgi:hypothetical protein